MTVASKDVLEALNDVPRMPGDAPMDIIRIVKCGATTSKGDHESLEESAAKESKVDAAQRLEKESREARSALMEALEVNCHSRHYWQYCLHSLL